MKSKATSGSAVVTLPSDIEIRIVREFAVPPRLVYKAWTTPDLIRQWWSARRGTVTLAEVDLRVGGRWRFVMIADGGFTVGFHGEYRELVENELIVCTEVYEAMPDAEAVNTMRFEDLGGRTRLTITARHSCREHRDAHINSGMEAGMQDAMDLLELAVLTPV